MPLNPGHWKAQSGQIQARHSAGLKWNADGHLVGLLPQLPIYKASYRGYNSILVVEPTQLKNII